MWIAWRLGPLEFQENDDKNLSKYLYQIIQKIESKDYNGEKLFWTINVLKMSHIMCLDGFRVTSENENEMYVFCHYKNIH